MLKHLIKTKIIKIAVALVLSVPFSIQAKFSEQIKLKDLCRIIGVRDNALAGYGIVTGLNGTGDTTRNRVTIQSIANTMQKFGVKIDPQQIYSRNVAAVMVMATLPAFSQPGDKLDVTVSSVGDARSLQGGALLLTHLKGPDGKIYALVQGPLSTGGYQFESNSNLVQKNHTTTATIPDGAIVEEAVKSRFVSHDGNIRLKLKNPDFTTARRIVLSINSYYGYSLAKAIDAGNIKVRLPESQRGNVVNFIAGLEHLSVTPDTKARIVVNERTGSIVAGGNVRISSVNITHGSLRVSVMTDFLVSQPSFVKRTGDGVRTVVVPETSINVNERKSMNVNLKNQTTVFELVSALNKIRASTQDIISILQSIKRAGALHAELVIQ